MQRIALTLTTLALLVACAEPATVTDAGPITAPPDTGQPVEPSTTTAPTSETSAPVGQTTVPAGETTSTTSRPPPRRR